MPEAHLRVLPVRGSVGGRVACRGGGMALPYTGARTSPHAIAATVVSQKHRLSCTLLVGSGEIS